MTERLWEADRSPGLESGQWILPFDLQQLPGALPGAQEHCWVSRAWPSIHLQNQPAMEPLANQEMQGVLSPLELHFLTCVVEIEEAAYLRLSPGRSFSIYHLPSCRVGSTA